MGPSTSPCPSADRGNGWAPGRSAKPLRGNCARGRRLGRERNEERVRRGSPGERPSRPSQGAAQRRPELRPRRARQPRTQRIPPHLPAAPPRPTCASRRRRRRPSRSRSVTGTAFPPLPSANYCFRVQKPPIRAAAQRRQFRDPTPPPEAGRGGRRPRPRGGPGGRRPRPLSAGLSCPDP